MASVHGNITAESPGGGKHINKRAVGSPYPQLPPNSYNSIEEVRAITFLILNVLQ